MHKYMGEGKGGGGGGPIIQNIRSSLSFSLSLSLSLSLSPHCGSVAAAAASAIFSLKEEEGDLSAYCVIGRGGGGGGDLMDSLWVPPSFFLISNQEYTTTCSDFLFLFSSWLFAFRLEKEEGKKSRFLPNYPRPKVQRFFSLSFFSPSLLFSECTFKVFFFFLSCSLSFPLSLSSSFPFPLHFCHLFVFLPTQLFSLIRFCSRKRKESSERVFSRVALGVGTLLVPAAKPPRVEEQPMFFFFMGPV